MHDRDREQLDSSRMGLGLHQGPKCQKPYTTYQREVQAVSTPSPVKTPDLSFRRPVPAGREAQVFRTKRKHQRGRIPLTQFSGESAEVSRHLVLHQTCTNLTSTWVIINSPLVDS